MWGAAPRPGRGRALRARRTENRERRTERPCGATDKAAVQSGDSRKNQTSKLPNFRLLLHPQARLRRAQWRCNGGTGDAGDAGAPGKRATEGNGVWGGAPSREPSFQTAKLPSLQTSKLPNKKASKLLNFQTTKKPPTGKVGGFCRVGPNYSAAGVSAGVSAGAAAGALSTHSRTHISVASPRRKPSLVMRV